MNQRRMSYDAKARDAGTGAVRVRRRPVRPVLVLRRLGGTVLLSLAIAACAGSGGSTDDAAAADGVDGPPPGADAGPAADRPEPPPRMLPRFTADGELIRPEGWEGWVAAGTSMGLTYDEPDRLPEPGEPPGDFLMVYVQPWAYDHYRETGEFAEGTMFVLAGAEPIRKADPARGGFYQGELVLLEVHLKREGLHDSGWGFYGFGGADDRSAPLIPRDASCYSCHRDNAAHDHVFTQFYPPMRDGLASAAAPEGEAGIRPPGGGADGGGR